MNKPAPFTENQTRYIKNTLHSWFNVAEGGKRGGKNVMQTLSFCMALETHPNKLHLIAGVSQTTARLNIVDCDGFGLTNYFEGRYREGKYKERACIYVQTKTGEKVVLVSGGAKKGDEKYIKGNTYGMAYVTEANECHPDFIQEVFDRTLSSADRKIFHDLNPKAPKHWYYTDVLDYHEERQKEDKNYGYNYGHFTIADNLSVSTDKLKKILKTYKKGTVWYERDIKGKRRTAEGIVFEDIANDATPFIISTEKVPKQFRWVELGFDIGGNGSAYALTCVAQGYDNQYYTLKSKKVQADKLKMQDIERFIASFGSYIEEKYGAYIELINSDHIAVVINSINENTDYRAVMTYKPPLEDRPFVMNKLLANKEIWFVENECDDLIEELQELVFDDKSDKPTVLDDGSMQIDTWDSWVYSMCHRWKYIEI